MPKTEGVAEPSGNHQQNQQHQQHATQGAGSNSSSARYSIHCAEVLQAIGWVAMAWCHSEDEAKRAAQATTYGSLPARWLWAARLTSRAMISSSAAEIMNGLVPMTVIRVRKSSGMRSGPGPVVY